LARQNRDNQALDILRRKFSRNEIPIDHGSGEEGEGLGAVLPYPGDSPETDVIKSEFRAMLAQAIEELDEKLRVVYVMREMGEFSMEELADILELSVSAAKARLFEARKRLEKRLRRQTGNP
jgi:RNA polymerase sigma-70 factor, ECF subfamily